MQAIGFKNTAYLAKRFFNGKAHTIPDKSATVFEAEFVDVDSFKFSWILLFLNVMERYKINPVGDKSIVLLLCRTFIA